MISILVATDFSPAADNASRYAIRLAEFLEAKKIVLFHAYPVPILPVEDGRATSTFEQLERTARNAMRAAAERLQTASVKVPVERWCVPGFAVGEILKYIQVHPTDLVVVGMRGAGFVTARMLGSVATALIRESKCPILTVGEHMEFKVPEKLLLACDFKEIAAGTLVFLSDLAKRFNSHVHILNVGKEEELPLSEMVETGLDLEIALAGITHAYHETKHPDLVEGINDFVQREQMDIVVMVPRRHSLVHRLFHVPATKRAAYHSLVPILTIGQ